MKTIGIDAAYAITWKELMKMMTEVYCPRNEIQKLEDELWNLTVKDNDVVAKESGKMSRNEIIANNKTRGKKRVGYTLLELVTREAMLELYHSATSSSFITTVHVPLNVKTARKSATKQETDGPLLWWHAIDVERKYTPRGTALEWRIGIEMKKLFRTLTLLRVRPSLKNRYIPVLTNANANRSFVFTAIIHLIDVASTFSVT
ncbi:hypothetical protein Tco_1374381 [Tanacetum coccineum]